MRFDLLINHFTKDAVTRRKVVVYGDRCWRPYLHVGDVGRAIMLVVEADEALVRDKVFNVGGADLNYCKRKICDLVGRQVPEAEFDFVEKNDDPRSYRVDFSKMRDTLGFVPTRTVQDGIREVKAALENGAIADTENSIYYN